ncbi:transposable element Tc1 transposase [Trichonephila clavipes]|nr:transposable element Tc1 transposase [Trichonephila clavipes]
MSVSSICRRLLQRGLRARVPLCRIPFPANYRRLSLQWAHAHRAWYVREVLRPEVVPFLHGIPGAIFQQDNARPHVAKTVRDFCLAQHVQLLSWSAYSTDMSPIEHM